MKLLTVLGTRPEAIKMAPVLHALAAEKEVRSLLCATGQHGELARPALDLFGLRADFELGPRPPGEALNPFLARAVRELDALFEREAPDRILVHGDTASALAAAIAAHQRGLPIVHVEAGLRSYRADSPWPEETNRRAIDLMSDLLLAPTRIAAANLAAERIGGRVLVTGNSAVDALQWLRARIAACPALAAAADAEAGPLPDGPLLLVTAHRRESHGEAIDQLCAALLRIADERYYAIAFPLHPNPLLRRPIEAALAGREGIALLPPLGPAAFLRLMERSALILTDSGGVQEEAPSLGKPVLLFRETSERPEGLRAGSARLAGRDAHGIVEAVRRCRRFPPPAPAFNPFGDGRAAARIVAALLGRATDEFAPPAAAAPAGAVPPSVSPLI